jgi:Family of unknown function (DUF6600)
LQWDWLGVHAVTTTVTAMIRIVAVMNKTVAVMNKTVVTITNTVTVITMTENTADREGLQMKRIKWMGLLVCSFLTAVATVPLSSAADEPAMVVGRIFYIEGDLLRYIPAEKDWVAVVRDAPFGTEDTLFSGSRGMAELIVPNGTWIRIGNSTQIQFIALDTDLAEMDVASGVARFYNKGSDTLIKVTSPFGYVLGDPGAVFDFYVGENSVEVVAVRGKVSFVHSATDAKYDVVAGSPSILADQQQVSSGEGTVDPDWNRWNTVRENFWASKARVRGRSVEYLPPSLRDEAYALDENGSWESVPYEGTSRWFWRPRVVAGWSPFTVGRWTDWYGDQTWIPAEPFGYVTHHYGNWVYVRNYWYWAPPVVSMRVGLPLLDVGFFWYPGRVSWIHTGTYVGWVPLAPRETYYSYRHWGGPHVVVVNNVNITQININVRNYAYANHAVVVNQNNFYRVNNYRNVRVTNINRTTIINNYRAAPVVNNAVINNYTTINQRYNYTTAKVNEKPHNTVINRIQQNETIIQKGEKEKASVVQERVKGIPEGKVNREVRIEAPKGTNYIVPANQVNRPKSEIKLQQREIKTSGKPGQQEKPGKPEQPAARPERVTPAKPAEKGVDRSKKVEKPESATKESKPQEKVGPEKSKETTKPSERGTIEKPREVKPPERTIEKPREVKPPERTIEKPKEIKPPERTIQKPREVKPPEKAIQKPKEVKPPERAIEKPREVKPPERTIQKPREQRPVEKQIEKPKESRPSEKDLEKQRERKLPEEEREKPR